MALRLRTRFVALSLASVGIVAMIIALPSMRFLRGDVTFDGVAAIADEDGNDN